MAYTLVGQPLSSCLDTLSHTQVKAQWHDPNAGTRIAIGPYPRKGVQEFVVPSRGAKDNWVLVLDALP